MTFEDRLLTELTHHLTDRPVPPPRPARRRLRIALPGAAAAAAAAIVVAIVAGSAGDPAYAVEPRADGTVAVTITDLTDAAGLEAKLRDLGVTADVNYVADPRPCAVLPHAPEPSTDGRERHDDLGPSPSTAGSPPQPGSPPASVFGVRIDGDAVTFTVDPDMIKPGETLTITTAGPEVTSVMVGIVKDGTSPATPACIPQA